MGLFHRKKPDGSRYPTLMVKFQYRGVRVSEDTRKTTKVEARQWIRDRKREIDERAGSRRSTRKPVRLSVTEALDRYSEDVRKFAGSWESDKYVIGQIQLALGSLQLSELSTSVIMSHVATLRASGKLAPASINKRVEILQAAHNYAREVLEIEDLRAIAWRKLKLKLPNTVIVTPDVAGIARLAQCATPRMSRCITFAVLTGLRKSEIRSLKWENIDLTTEPATIKFRGKGKKEAVLPLSSAATSLVSSMPQGQSSRVFDMENFRREWHDARTKAGFPNMRFHDLRHVFARLFREATKDKVLTKDAMRHSDMSMTSHYAPAVNLELYEPLEAVARKLLSSPTISAPSSLNERSKPDEEPTE